MTANATNFGRTLLLVDDEPLLLAALKRELQGMDFMLLTPSSGNEALDIPAESGVQVILSDDCMPGMSGVECLTEARRLLQDRLEQVLAKRHRNAAPAAVIFLDLDHFKQLNDVHGHEAGDELLKLGAQRPSQCVRRDDTVARQGGDEFIVLLAEINASEGAERVAAKIVQAPANPYHLPKVNLTITTVTTSVGIAVSPGPGTNVQDLLKRADPAVYAAKESGRNGYRLYDTGLSG